MNWIRAVFLLLVPSASADNEDRSDNLRGLRRSANQSRRSRASGADHDERMKERNNNEHESYESISTPSAENSQPSTAVATTEEAATTSTSTTISHVKADEVDSEGFGSDENAQQPQRIRSSINRSSVKKNLHVSHVYTYGAPSVVKGPAMSNPNNACIPGLRIYTEDFGVKTCSWWQLWCTPGGEEVTDVDFAAQINVKEGYPHPKMSTLVLRLEEGGWKAEYTYRACRDYKGRNQYAHQWWPAANLQSDIIPGWNIHDLDYHYESRLMHVPSYIRGPSLEYVSVAKCSYESSFGKLRNCLNNYNKKTSSRIGGVVRSGWQTFAYMTHTTESNMSFLSDSDTVYMLKKDQNANYRKCIIGFQGSDGTSDLKNFILSSKGPTGYCGRYGVHSGVKNELWKITHDSQYANVIVPALETCHEVTCVGHSLGGAICNLFTMCANQGLENLDGSNNKQMWDDYDSLIWQMPS